MSYVPIFLGYSMTSGDEACIEFSVFCFCYAYIILTSCFTAYDPKNREHVLPWFGLLLLMHMACLRTDW